MSSSERRTAYLVIRPEGEPERAIVWDTLDISVGRQKTQDIVVEDPEVSRSHAVFRRKNDQFLVEDLGTGLGTLVNDEPVTSRPLTHGDVIRIGKLTLRFGQTTAQVRAGANVSFASHLKGGLSPAPDASASGRTMLGFDPEDSLLFAQPTKPRLDPGPRAVTADGSLEEIESTDPLGLSIDGASLGPAPEARDLDRELEDKPDDPAVGAQPLPSAGPARASAPLAAPTTPSLGVKGDLTAEMRLVLSGPVTDVAALVALFRDRPIRIGSVELRIHDRES